MDNRIELPEYIARVDGDRAYPIYHFQAHFKYDGVDMDYCGSWMMYPKVPSAECLLRELTEWWGLIVNKKRTNIGNIAIAEKHPVLYSIVAKLAEYETWCLRWFSHYTYTEGRSDDELLQSFNRFRQRKLQKHYAEEYCLMGAEEEWRIKPPCRCEECEKKGITQIRH